jgi:hypothetical protein
MLAVLACASLTLAGCGGNPHIQTNPVGAIAAYGTQVTNAVRAVQSVVITAEAAQLLPTDKARVVIGVTRELGLKAQMLADGLTELQAVTGDDISKRAVLAKVGIIVRAMNDLVLQVIVPVDNVQLREQLRVVLTEVSGLLITVSGAIGV